MACASVTFRQQMKVSRCQGALILLILALTSVLIFLAAEANNASKPTRDMVQFWAAAHLIQQNPYSLSLVSTLERSVGVRLSLQDTFAARNPPWSLLFFLPLCPLSYRAAYGVWTVLSVVLLVGCGRALWRLYSPTESLLPIFICLFYGPSVALLYLGQSTILVLLGIAIFLLAVFRGNDWMAGAALVLVSIKPHIVLLFLLAIVFWTIRQRRWRIFAGGALAVLVASAVVLLINHHIFEQYVQFVRVFAHEKGPYPNLGGLLYAITGQQRLAMLPEAIGLVWLAVYYRSHRDSWDWTTDGSLTILVSLACSYYSYGYDEIILLPPLLAAAATGNRRVFFPAFLAIDLAYVLFFLGYTERSGFTNMFLWWTASAWLVAYLLSVVCSRRGLQARIT